MTDLTVRFSRSGGFPHADHDATARKGNSPEETFAETDVPANHQRACTCQVPMFSSNRLIHAAHDREVHFL